MFKGMVTTSHSPAAQHADQAGHGGLTDHDEHADSGRHGTARSVVRGAGALLGAAWRVVLFGGDFKH
jgi:hypothetical protein